MSICSLLDLWITSREMKTKESRNPNREFSHEKQRSVDWSQLAFVTGFPKKPTQLKHTLEMPSQCSHCNNNDNIRGPGSLKHCVKWSKNIWVPILEQFVKLHVRRQSALEVHLPLFTKLHELAVKSVRISTRLFLQAQMSAFKESTQITGVYIITSERFVLIV